MLKPVSLLAAALLCLLVPVLAVADDDGIAIDETNFPDILFRDYCYDNQLSSLDVSNNTALVTLSCFWNQLSSLDVSKNTSLRHLNCSTNPLSSLNVSKNTALQNLNCSGNQLSSLDVSKNTSLRYLYCSGNQLSSLDVSKNTALQYLYCSGNPLSSLDVSKNTSLLELYCSGNQLTSLDVSNNSKLWMLDCSGNQLSSLDLSSNPRLSFANLDSNRCTVTVGSDRILDLTKLPGAFDVKKASGWAGGSISGHMLTVDRDVKEVTYTYDCGQGNSEKFTLLVVELPQTGDASRPGLWLALLALSTSALALLLRRRAA